MDWSAEDIRKNFHGVIKDSRILRKEQLEKKYSNFKEKNDKLYQIAIDSSITGKVQESLKKLEMMLKAREDMKNGKMTKLNTDILIGSQLGREYIYPKTSMPSQEDYKRAIDTIKKKAVELEIEEAKEAKEEAEKNLAILQ